MNIDEIIGLVALFTVGMLVLCGLLYGGKRPQAAVSAEWIQENTYTKHGRLMVRDEDGNWNEATAEQAEMITSMLAE